MFMASLREPRRQDCARAAALQARLATALALIGKGSAQPSADATGVPKKDAPRWRCGKRGFSTATAPAVLAFSGVSALQASLNVSVGGQTRPSANKGDSVAGAHMRLPIARRRERQGIRWPTFAAKSLEGRRASGFFPESLGIFACRLCLGSER
jgi:hypothetical protein